jgi:hypothetical protein
MDCTTRLLILLFGRNIAAASNARQHRNDYLIEARNAVTSVARWKIVPFGPLSRIKNRTARDLPSWQASITVATGPARSFMSAQVIN